MFRLDYKIIELILAFLWCLGNYLEPNVVVLGIFEVYSLLESVIISTLKYYWPREVLLENYVISKNLRVNCLPVNIRLGWHIIWADVFIIRVNTLHISKTSAPNSKYSMI